MTMKPRYYFMGKRKILWFSLSLVIMLAGVIALAIWRLPLGIDFKGGTEMSVVFEKDVDIANLRERLTSYQGGGGAAVIKTGDREYFLRLKAVTNEEHQKILASLQNDFGAVTEKEFQLVGPTISNDLTRKAIWAVVLASSLIVLYLAYSFREVRNPVSSWRFGLTAVIALLHDLIISAGVFTILAHYFHWEIDSSLITALLTIMGFSVHDTIVVFDRVRENLILRRQEAKDNFEGIVDLSLAQTLNRSLTTSLTVIFTLTALVVLGGTSIRPFASLLLVGITIGTYSSLFTASPLLVVWQNRYSQVNQKI